MIAKEEIQGTIVIDSDKAALRLKGENAGSPVFLSYALVTQGPGYHILPSVLLDDWGQEINQLAIYPWIRENGLRFPRAEVFGVSPTGQPEQYFLRDLELFGAAPVYAFAAEDAPDASGVLLRAVLIDDESVDLAQPISPPPDVSGLLREAQVSWWAVNPRLDDLDFLD
jgi:hypothetical protein